MASDPTENTFEGPGGLKIFYRAWKPSGAPKAVVVMCHGVNAHSGQQVWAGGQFADAGYAVYAADLPGRGRSEGKRFFTTSIMTYVATVAKMIETAKAANPGKAVFLLGHSAGGVTSTTYALDNQDKIAGLICESFAYRVWAPDFALPILKFLGKVAPGLPVLKLPMQAFSRDPAAVQALLADPLTKNEQQPAATVGAFVTAGERLHREFSKITLPVFIIHGTADKATVPAGSQEFFDKASSKDKTLKLYDGHFHDLLNDVGKEGVMADIIAWIAKRVPA
jgi:acylglycerol lipase